jgi:hypothetical protein
MLKNLTVMMEATTSNLNLLNLNKSSYLRSRLGRDRTVVGFTTTYAISTYHHYNCDATLCDKVCQ